MRHTRIIAAIALTIALGGCANFGAKLQAITAIATGSVANPVSKTNIASVESAYAIALIASNAYADRYRDGHRCTKSSLESVTNLCARRSIVLKLQAADLKAQEALNAAKEFIARNPTLDASSLIDAAQTAVAAFASITGS